MKIALTEAFLADLTSLPSGLQRKCREMLSTLHRIEAKDLREQSLPGWRLHRLHSSPFISLSLDMNYRVLVKLEGETIFLHRAVKHALADSVRINRNDSSAIPYMVEPTTLEPCDVYGAVVSLGLGTDDALPFKNVRTEDDLLRVLASVDEGLASLALGVYETTGLVIPRTKYTLLQPDKDFESLLTKGWDEWNLYLHPSQSYVVRLPGTSRLAVCGSAGTGKTVCAWYRLRHLATQGQVVGFVAPNHSTLSVSKRMIERLLRNSPVDAYFLVPQSADELAQLAAAVKHIIIDEGQELTPNWYTELGRSLKEKDTGITIFYDLNQLGGNYQTGDSKRYEHRLSRWDPGLSSIPNCDSLDFYINYRNSREIAQYYYQLLQERLPQPIRSEIPIFSSGDVSCQSVKDVSQLPMLLVSIIRNLRTDYKYGDIGIICLDERTSPEFVCRYLERLSVPTSTQVDSGNRVLVTKPRVIRGHERKAIIACVPSQASRDLGQTINSYIAYSRARDRLFVIEITGR